MTVDGDAELMKNRKWFVFLPGEVYANDYRFERPVTEREVREYVRERLGVERLPRGTQVWQTEEN